ncbi:MAG TPA: UbiA family prenyltransferase [Candidatus Diapherotrites archaeon]|uniref:UbiA family prenyltransferase n=1 Tax=Candidatus Iainarchaeum sp. TaxID=3101447 RepID=A0A7J4JU07_9ARCH|nr:UbiA family prenyltransferase [Candidatus Diapherotrites archaeon]
MVYSAYLAGNLLNFTNISFFSLAFGFLLSFFFIGSFNSFNAVFDIDVDKESKPKRPIPAGLISKNLALSYSLFLYFAFIVLLYVFYSFEVFVIGMIMIILSVFYSSGLRLKRFPLLSDLLIAITYTVFPMLLGFLIGRGNLFSLPNPQFAIVFLFGFAVLITKNFEDFVADKKHGLKTLPVIFGIKQTLALVILLFLVSDFVLLLLLLRNQLPSYLSLILFFTLPVFFHSFRRLWEEPSQKNAFKLFKHLAVFMLALELLTGFSLII